MLALDQGDIQELIENLSNFLADHTESLENEWITKWIYSTLACLTIPLFPEVHSSIRTIAKSCIQIIENLISSNENADILPYNLLITIIVKVFHQFDLLSS
jgi:survival of motor neuron protein-interacting protein 1